MTTHKQLPSGKGGKPYDLEERTFLFAQTVRAFVKLLPNTMANQEDGRQLIRASGSVGGNYIEANEALSKKDLLLRLRIARKEAKESRYWLRLVEVADDRPLAESRADLIAEATELLAFLSAIIKKAESAG
jgi:four helix bundle protein